jgi:hypothetical protein
MSARTPAAALVALLLIAFGLTACGSDSGSNTNDTVAPVPSASEFPPVKGKSMLQIYNQLGAGGPVLAPTVEQLVPGRNRYGFALFTVARKQIGGVPVALYVQRQGSKKTVGPFVARDLNLAVAPPYRSETVARDPQAAKSLYVVPKLPLGKPGTYAVMAVAKLDGRLVATNPTRAVVLAHDPVPNVGDKAPVIDTPTVASSGGNIRAIDTRSPPDDMHEVSFKDVVGKKPVMLIFATPALCQSRVCGPVVDIAEEVKNETKDDVAFIHMEVYLDNTIKPGCLENTRPENQCLRPQFLAYHLATEPWAFAIDRHGRIAARLEGAYSKSEFVSAMRAAERG